MMIYLMIYPYYLPLTFRRVFNILVILDNAYILSCGLARGHQSWLDCLKIFEDV